jgi:cytochrome oxidase Cu insertion factor (SCO1/SenC/PrrC family)
MKLLLLALLALHSAALAAPPVKLTDFELTDQDAKTRSYRFPKAKVTVMTVADHKGSEQLAPWIQRIRDRYDTRIDIDGVADVSIIPKAFHNVFRNAFRKKLTYSVMLDWGGDVVKQFGYTKGVANIYLIDRDGRIVKQMTGPVSDAGAQELFKQVDRVISEPLLK